MMLAFLLAAVSRCEQPAPPPGPSPDPKPGDDVRLRGTLDEDVDCRVLRADTGKTYSLNVRLRGYPNGAKVCLRGTLVEITSCMSTPMIDVQSVSAPSACP